MVQRTRTSVVRMLPLLRLWIMTKHGASRHRAAESSRSVSSGEEFSLSTDYTDVINNLRNLWIINCENLYLTPGNYEHSANQNTSSRFRTRNSHRIFCARGTGRRHDTGPNRRRLEIPRQRIRSRHRLARDLIQRLNLALRSGAVGLR